MNLTNRILLISDNEETAHYFMEQLFLTGTFSITVERTGEGGLRSFKGADFDLVIMKWHLPDMECGRLMREVRMHDSEMPVIVLFDDNNPEQVQQIVDFNMCLFISKPFSTPSVSFTIQKALELRSMLTANRRLVSIIKEQNVGLQKQNFQLARRVEDSTRNLTRLYEDLRSTYLRTIRALAQAIDARDHYTHSHSQNVSKYAAAVAREMGYTVKEVQTLTEASELHDIGKIGISDLILLKPSSLSREEWEAIRQHPQTGAQILEPLTFLSDVIELVRQHHEHFDGTGYPMGLKGEGILLGSRILHLADAYDAMVSARSYRKVPLTREQAIAELLKHSGTQFDPKVVEAFLKIINGLG
jgi:putative nucleotidyltransferase with HDIG domain